MIEARGISKFFDQKQVLFDIDATFDKGTTNLIIGQSGSGKNGFAKIAGWSFEIDKGEVFYDGRSFTQMNNASRKSLRQEVGMLFQGSALFDSMSVEQNVKFPLDMFTNMSEEEKRDRVEFCLNRVKIVNSNKLLPSEISGGMQKRVAIARAIALNPRYLFCDEPNSGLDPRTSVVIDELIHEITKEYDITTIVNTHDMNSVMGIGEKIFFIFEGKKLWEGTKDVIFDSGNEQLDNFIFCIEIVPKDKGKQVTLSIIN